MFFKSTGLNVEWHKIVDLLLSLIFVQVVYKDLHFGGSSAGTQRFVASQCCFDPRRAELCIASRSAETGLISCFSKSGGASLKALLAGDSSCMHWRTVWSSSHDNQGHPLQISDDES